MVLGILTFVCHVGMMFVALPNRGGVGVDGWVKKQKNEEEKIPSHHYLKSSPGL